MSSGHERCSRSFRVRSDSCRRTNHVLKAHFVKTSKTSLVPSIYVPDVYWSYTRRSESILKHTMATTAPATDTTPLLQSSSQAQSSPRSSPIATKPPRSVTFNPQVSSASPPKRRPAFPAASQSLSSNATATINPPREGGQPMLSSLNSKLRRRNSSGAALQLPAQPAPRIGPQRTTRTAQKQIGRAHV